MRELMTIHGVRGFLDESGTAYLNLSDVALGLGFSQRAGSGNEVVRWERVNRYLSELGFIPTSGDGNEGFIPENIFYRLAMKAKNQVAEAFQARVADEILPSIRKHGAYMTPAKIEEVLSNPDTIIQLATQLKKERGEKLLAEAKTLMLEQKIAEYEPRLSYLDQILQSPKTLVTTQIAADYGLSAYKLNQILNEERVQRKVNGQWLLYIDHQNKGYTKSETIDIRRSNGEKDVTLNTKWTQKGRLFIHEILQRRGIAPTIER